MLTRHTIVNRRITEGARKVSQCSARLLSGGSILLYGHHVRCHSRPSGTSVSAGRAVGARRASGARSNGSPSTASSAHGTGPRARRLQDRESDTEYDTRRRAPGGALDGVSQTAVYGQRSAICVRRAGFRRQRSGSVWRSRPQHGYRAGRAGRCRAWAGCGSATPAATRCSRHATGGGSPSGRTIRRNRRPGGSR